MGLNPLAPVIDYQSMLNRIFWFTSAAALGAIWLLRANCPVINTALSHIDFSLSSQAGHMLPLPGGDLLAALAVGLSARVFRIHGLLSHWLGISERFDIEVIMAELARLSGVDTARVTDEQWIEHRHDVMRQAFYRYANNRDPQVDEHLIHQALDLWSWFWIGLQTTLTFVLTGFMLIAFAEYTDGALTIALTLLLATLGLPAIRNQCKRYAIAQVKSIISNPTRAAEVREAFHWVEPASENLRRAA